MRELYAERVTNHAEKMTSATDITKTVHVTTTTLAERKCARRQTNLAKMMLAAMGRTTTAQTTNPKRKVRCADQHVTHAKSPRNVTENTRIARTTNTNPMAPCASQARTSVTRRKFARMVNVLRTRNLVSVMRSLTTETNTRVAQRTEKSWRALTHNGDSGREKVERSVKTWTNQPFTHPSTLPPSLTINTVVHTTLTHTYCTFI